MLLPPCPQHLPLEERILESPQTFENWDARPQGESFLQNRPSSPECAGRIISGRRSPCWCMGCPLCQHWRMHGSSSHSHRQACPTRKKQNREKGLQRFPHAFTHPPANRICFPQNKDALSSWPRRSVRRHPSSHTHLDRYTGNSSHGQICLHTADPISIQGRSVVSAVSVV